MYVRVSDIRIIQYLCIMIIINAVFVSICDQRSMRISFFILQGQQTSATQQFCNIVLVGTTQ